MKTSHPRVYVLPGALKESRRRHEPALSQKELAELSGVSLGLIGLIETGERQPRFGNAQAIADALGVEIGAFALVLDDHEVARLRKVLGEETAAA